MNIFKYDDYRRYIRDYIDNQPKKGRGQVKKIAEALNTHSVIVSQVLSETRDFTPEQAADLGDYLGLSELEEEYFFVLVHISRAGTERLRNRLKKKLAALKTRSEKLSERVPTDKKLDESALSKFYSGWFYSATRLSTDIADSKTPEAIAEKLDLPLSKVREVLHFLVSHGLCDVDKGEYGMAVQATHLAAENPLIAQHHRNWRLRGLQRFERKSPDDLFYSGPMTLSHELAEKIREDLVRFISKTVSSVKKSPSERLGCLGIDWYEI